MQLSEAGQLAGEEAAKSEFAAIDWLRPWFAQFAARGQPSDRVVQRVSAE